MLTDLFHQRNFENVGNGMTDASLASRVGSPLLAELIIERKRLRKVFYPPRRRSKTVSLPKCSLLPVEERLAEAEAIECDYDTKRKMRNAILQSARDFGECLPCERRPRIAIPGRPTIMEIQRLVAWRFDVNRDDILSACHLARFVRPRHIAMYLSRLLTRRSLAEICRLFRRHNHTTVLHAEQKYKRLIGESWWLATEIETIKGMLS